MEVIVIAFKIVTILFLSIGVSSCDDEEGSDTSNSSPISATTTDEIDDETAEPDATETTDQANANQPDTVIIAGQLLLDESYSESATLLENNPVDLQDASGQVIASGFSDASGNYSIQAPSQLILDQGTAGLVSKTLRLSSVIEEDGQGKVMGVRQDIEIDASKISEGKFQAGSFNFAEISAIKGSIKFVNPDATENTAIAKISTDVFLPGFSFFAKTDHDGKFLLLYVPPADYTIRVEKGSVVHEQSVTVEANTTLNLGEISIQTDTEAPITTASKDSTDFRDPMCVSLTSDDADADIYYSTDGSNPTATTPFAYDASTTSSCGSSSDCSICVKDQSTTLKYFAVDTAGNSEDIKAKFYFYNEKWADPDDSTAPTTTFKIDGNTETASSHVFSQPVQVTFAANEGATIYYTLDGSDPTTSGVEFSYPIDIGTTTTLKYHAIDYASNAETVSTKTIRILNWTKMSTNTTPAVDTATYPNCFAPAMAYDSDRDKAILVNCESANASSLTIKTYEWSGSDWDLVDAYTDGSNGLNTTGADYRPGIFYSEVKDTLYLLLYQVVSSNLDLVLLTYAPDANNGSTDNWTKSTVTGDPGLGSSTTTTSLAVAAIEVEEQDIALLLIDDMDGNGTAEAYLDLSGGAPSLTQATTSGTLYDDSGKAFAGSFVKWKETDNVKYHYFGGGEHTFGQSYSVPANFSQTAPDWTVRLPGSIEPANIGPSLVYDEERNKILAFGGQVTSGGGSPTLIAAGTNDLYEFSDNTWIQAQPSNTPPKRSYPAMVYLPTSKEVLVFGGHDVYGRMMSDTWIYGD